MVGSNKNCGWLTQKVPKAKPHVSYRGVPCVLVEDSMYRSIPLLLLTWERFCGLRKLFVSLCLIFWNMMGLIRDRMLVVTTLQPQIQRSFLCLLWKSRERPSESVFLTIVGDMLSHLPSLKGSLSSAHTSRYLVLSISSLLLSLSLPCHRGLGKVTVGHICVM